ncbi:hypothetical protein Tco_0967177 [Tanacetum coccineum]
MASQDARLFKFEVDFKQQQNEMTNKINTVLKAITDRIAGALPSDTIKNPKLSTYLVLSACSYLTEDPQCSIYIHGSINAITIHPKQQSESHDDKPKENEEQEKDNPKNIHVNPSVPPDPSILFITEKAVKNVIENESHFSLEVVDQDLSSLAMFTKHLMGEQRKRVIRVGEGKEEFMGGIGGGSFSIRLMVGKDGLGVMDSLLMVEDLLTYQVKMDRMIMVKRLSEKLVELPMCSPMVERMVDKEEMRFLDC